MCEKIFLNMTFCWLSDWCFQVLYKQYGCVFERECILLVLFSDVVEFKIYTFSIYFCYSTLLLLKVIFQAAKIAGLIWDVWIIVSTELKSVPVLVEKHLRNISNWGCTHGDQEQASPAGNCRCPEKDRLQILLFMSCIVKDHEHHSEHLVTAWNSSTQ